ncbi:MAG: alpha/beta hydrolase family protein [Croceibacterium sp.]
MHIRTEWYPLGALAITLAMAGCGGSDEPVAGDLVSADSYAAPSAIAADSRLLIHWMRGADGQMAKATSLLFVPRDPAPANDWPLVSWVHGTTTVGWGVPASATCSASASATLDGGITADGFVSHYVETIASLVAAGYAVMAPDLEGLGAEAQRNGTPYPYYNLASSGRSVAAGIVAAHQAVKGLSANWASVGHSEGGHVVLALESTAGDAAAYPYKGAVAIAPFNSIEASVGLIDAAAAADPVNLAAYRTEQQLFVGMMAAALATQQPGFQPSRVMGSDLLALMPSYRSQCIFKLLGIVGQDVATKTPAAYKGFSAQWAADASMKAFLQTNDPAVTSGFRVAKPTLVLQGTADPFVFESLQTPLVGRWQSAGMPITYKTFAGAVTAPS